MPIETEERFDFRGGVSRLRRQNKNEIYYLQNARPTADGTITVRKGQTLRVDFSSAGCIEALHVRNTSTLGTRFYSIRRTTGVTDLIFDGTTELSGASFGSSLYSSIAEYKGVIFFSNGATAINYHTPPVVASQTWGASNWGAAVWGDPNVRAIVSGSPTPPRGPFLKVYKDRLYVTGAEDGLLSWSNAGLFETLPTVDFPALNFQTIGGDGDPCTGFAIGENFLVAFTAGTYQIMTGTPGDNGGVGDMNWQVFNNIGCKASRSIASSGKKVAFLGSNRRMYILEGSVLTDIDPTDKIREYLSSPGESFLHAVGASFYGNELWIRLPKGSSTTIGQTLVYNTVLQNWTVFTALDGYSFHYAPSTGRLYVGRCTDSKIYEQDSGETDPDGNIEFEVISRQEVFGTFRKRKSYKKLGVQMDLDQENSQVVSYSLENATVYVEFGVGSPVTHDDIAWGEEIWGASSWGGTALHNQFLQPLAAGNGVQGTEMRIKIAGPVAPGDRLLSYELDAEILPRDEEVT